MGKYVNRVGEIHNNIKIMQELGYGYVSATCLVCNKNYRYTKISLARDVAVCKNKCCINSKPKHFKNRLGEVHRNLEIITDDGNDEVLCKCAKCGYEGIYKKTIVVNNKTRCRKCGKNKMIKDKTGRVYGTLEITKELGKKKVICKCTSCSAEEEYFKHNVVSGKQLCRQCGVPRTTFIDRVGETFRNLLVIEELGNKYVKCRCTDCGEEDDYLKGSVTRSTVTCRHCSLAEHYEGKIIKQVKVIDFAYTGRNKLRYFNCVCMECGEVLLLNEKEIPKYKCESR